MSAPSILHLLSSTSWGGLELYVCTVIAAQHRQGHRVTALVVPHSRAWEYLRARGVPLAPSGGAAYLNIRDIRRVRALLRAHPADAVHVHTRFDVWTAAIALRTRPGVRLVAGVYMNVAPKRDAIHRRIYGRVDAIVTSSTAVADEIRARYPVAPERVHVVRYGVDFAPYTPDAASRAAIRAALGVGKDALLVGTMGRIDPQKGVREFVASYGLLGDAAAHIRYLVLGDPTLRRMRADGTPEYEPACAACDVELRATIARHGWETRVLRRGFQDDFLPWLRALDVFALPSYAETYSLAVVNAMAMGLPVIGTAAGGTIEQVGDDERGTRIPPRDARAIAGAVRFYATHPDVRARHGAAARAWAHAEHGMERTLRRLDDLYRPG